MTFGAILMKIKIVCLLIMILVSSVKVTAQVSSEKLILNEEQNDKWISELEKETKSKQLELIRSRILLDTMVYPQSDVIYINIDKKDFKRTISSGGPLLVFNSELFIDIYYMVKIESIKKLTKFLNDENIEKVRIMKKSEAMKLYGDRGRGGVVLLTTRNKGKLRQIRKINWSR
jgi:hypothetical protein